MPELPEVETIKRSLTPIIGKQILDVESSGKKFRIMPVANFGKLLLQQNIYAIDRRSKYLLIHLSNHKTLIIHLGMSGKLLISPNQIISHVHLRLKLDQNMNLVFSDPRRFGLYLVEDSTNLESHVLFRSLGIEPLTHDFNSDYLYEKLKKSTSPVKNLIMDAKIVVGVGNIYASESLFNARISPLKKGCDITKSESSILCESIKHVLLDAIASGGSTLRDYVRSTGDIGYFQHKFQVYGRNGQNCYKCNSVIFNHKINKRSTYYCPFCQR